jgi:hypothetical protein
MRTLRSLLVSMQRLLDRARHHVALGALTAALGLLGVVTPGCETDEGRVLYGPAPINDAVDASADVPADVAYPDAVYYGPPPADVSPDQVQVYYGPQPVDVVNDGTPVPDGVQPDQPAVYYGPQPTDVVDDRPPADVETDQPMVYYGPPPTDVVQDQVPDQVDPEVAPLYGVQPVDVVPGDTVPDVVPSDCPPMAFYGPPPCSSDAECQADYGANWYCDKTNSYPDGCGGTLVYPQCKPKE